MGVCVHKSRYPHPEEGVGCPGDGGRGNSKHLMWAPGTEPGSSGRGGRSVTDMSSPNIKAVLSELGFSAV